MAKPYSLDLRERVKQAVDEGHTHSEVAAMLNVGIATVERYLARWRQTGNLAPAKFGGHKRHKLAEHEAVVKKLIEDEADRPCLSCAINWRTSGLRLASRLWIAFCELRA